MLHMRINIEVPVGGALVNACHDSDPSSVDACTDDCPICDNCVAFSWQGCETCGSKLGGERHAVAIIFAGTDRENEYYSACVECYLRIEGSFDALHDMGAI